MSKIILRGKRDIMKNISLVILTCLMITGCSLMEITGSGNIISRQLKNTGFSSIIVDNNCQLEITQGSEYSVTIYCDDNISNLIGWSFEKCLAIVQNA